MSRAFYTELLDDRHRWQWAAWLREWLEAIAESGTEETRQQMRHLCPKFVPREW